MRINGKPRRAAAGAEAVGQEHRGRRRRRPRGSRRASTRRCPASSSSSRRTTRSSFTRAINNVQEHALVGGILVVLIIFAFLRDFRSTLIVCTSIPVSVIGTFALLYFGGFTLNTMTFGGLALGIGMIVDAAIVVLENTHRHLHMGKDRMTAAIDGSEEVWSAILASTLTHIAVFVPLLFLSGTASIMFTQLSFVVMFSLAMSLFVAVTIVPVLCSRWLKTPDEEAHGDRHHGALLPRQRAVPRSDGRAAIAARFTSRSTTGRRSSAARRRWSSSAALIYPHDRRSSCCRRPTRARSTSTPSSPSARASSAPRKRCSGSKRWSRANVPEAVTHHHQRRRRRQQLTAAAAAAARNRGQIRIMLVPRDQRTRTNEEIAIELRRAAVGPARRRRPRQPGRRQHPDHAVPAAAAATTTAASSRLSLEIRGHDLDDARRIAQDVARDDGGHARHRRRAASAAKRAAPRSPMRVDRPKAAMLGMTVQSVATTIQTNVAGTTAAQFRERGNEYPIVVRLREADREEIADVGDVLLSTPTGQVVPAQERHGRQPRDGPGADRAQEHGAHHARQRRNRDPAQRSGQGRPGAPRPDARAAGLLGRLRLRGRGAGASRSAQLQTGADPRRAARLRGDGVAVRVAARPVHHHVLDPGGGDRRRR